MKIAIVWCSIYIDKPVRGLCIEYTDGSVIDRNTGLPKGEFRFFNLDAYYSTKYTLYSVNEDDLKVLEEERKVTEKIIGKTINHDIRFSFSSDFPSKLPSKIKHFMAVEESKVGEFDYSDIRNPYPYNVYKGIKFD